jgi:hypothetical protein
MRNAHGNENLIGNIIERRSVRRNRQIWRDNTKMDLRQKENEDADWIQLTEIGGQ